MPFTKIFFAAAAMTAAGTLLAGPMMSPAMMSDWTGTNKNVMMSNGAMMMKPGNARLVSKAAMDIKPDKGYTLSGMFRKAPGSKVDTKFYFGLASADANGNPIQSGAVNAYPETETTLAEPVKAGDKVLKVKDASKWKKANFTLVAFNTKKDLSDLPNNAMSPIIDKVEQKNGMWEVMLKSPMTKAYPAGTAIRQQTHGSTYMYTGAGYASAPQDWKEFSGKVKGIAKSGTPYNQWWAGTKKAKIVIFSLDGKPVEMEFKDIKLVED